MIDNGLVVAPTVGDEEVCVLADGDEESAADGDDETLSEGLIDGDPVSQLLQLSAHSSSTHDPCDSVLQNLFKRSSARDGSAVNQPHLRSLINPKNHQ